MGCCLSTTFYLWLKYDLGQKYYTPQVQPEWGSNSWPLDHDSTFHVIETPVLTTLQLGLTLYFVFVLLVFDCFAGYMQIIRSYNDNILTVKGFYALKCNDSHLYHPMVQDTMTGKNGNSLFLIPISNSPKGCEHSIINQSEAPLIDCHIDGMHSTNVLKEILLAW